MKRVCAKHEQAYEEQCPWCEPEEEEAEEDYPAFCGPMDEPMSYLLKCIYADGMDEWPGMPRLKKEES